jgi:hypothetical protein
MGIDDETGFDEEESEERSPEDTLALEFLETFIGRLVIDFRKYGFSSRTLMSLSRALYVTENFGKVTFDGSLTIASGTQYDGGGSASLEVTILSDELTFSLAGSEYTEGVGSDSVYREFYSIGQSHPPLDLEGTLEEWSDAFYIHFDDGKGLSVSDQIENLESPDKND